MSRYGYSIFCDDVRNEVGGKLSFVGCYNAVMFIPRVNSFFLPKFCIHTHIVSPATEPFRSIYVRCYAPGSSEPIVEELIDTPALSDQRRLVSELETGREAPKIIVAAASIILSPFEIRGAGLISVRAVVDDIQAEVSLGSLRVVVAD